MLQHIQKSKKIKICLNFFELQCSLSYNVTMLQTMKFEFCWVILVHTMKYKSILLSGTVTYYETLNRLVGESTLRWPISDHVYRRTGVMRTAGPKRHDHGQHRHNPMKHKRKPPRGMHLNYEDLQVIVNGPLSQADALLKSLDQELVSLKRQVVIYSC